MIQDRDEQGWMLNVQKLFVHMQRPSAIFNDVWLQRRQEREGIEISCREHNRIDSFLNYHLRTEHHGNITLEEEILQSGEILLSMVLLRVSELIPSGMI